MAICVTTITTASGVVFSPSSTSIGSCTDYAIYTASEYAVLNPVNTVDDVALMGGMVVAVWAVAWAIKVLRRAL